MAALAWPELGKILSHCQDVLDSPGINTVFLYTGICSILIKIFLTNNAWYVSTGKRVLKIKQKYLKWQVYTLFTFLCWVIQKTKEQIKVSLIVKDVFSTNIKQRHGSFFFLFRFPLFNYLSLTPNKPHSTRLWYNKSDNFLKISVIWFLFRRKNN